MATRAWIVSAALLASSSLAWAAPTPEQRCEGGKNETAAKLALCLAKAEKKFIASGDGTKYATAVGRCSDRFQSKWRNLEVAAVKKATVCPSVGDEAAVEGDVSGFVGCLADKLSGDTVDCSVGVSCPSCGAFPASGQTTAYGPGSDGDLEPGATMSFVDNGDGTITDNNTGLMWEKKDDSGGIHDKDNGYTWGMASAPYTMNGTIVSAFLDTLNDVDGGGANCFAGHCDWRIPSIKELQSIVDYEVLPGMGPSPTVRAAFHQAGTCTGCMDVTAATCSCTAFGNYWSSTTSRNNPSIAWNVYFGSGGVFADNKEFGLEVRAVRGGL